MKILFFLVSFLVQLICVGQTTPTQTQVNNATSSPNKALIQGANSYTANTLIAPTGNYSLTPTGNIVENAAGLHVISSASVSITGTSLKISNNAANGKILTSDASGFATWNEPYKEYVALVSQTGTLVPTATVLTNSIGSVSWTFFSDGEYKLHSAGGLFTTGKTIVLITSGVNQTDVMGGVPDSSTDILVTTQTGAGLIGYSNNILNNTTIIIRVYP